MSQCRGNSNANKKVCKSSTSSRGQLGKSRQLISTLRSSQSSSVNSNQKPVNVSAVLPEGADTNAGDEYRKELRDLVKRQKQERFTALKMAREKATERNRKIETNLAAIEDAARKAARLPSNSRKKTPLTLKQKAHNGFENYSGIIIRPDDKIPRECVLRASELLAEEDQPRKKPCRPIFPKSHQLHQRSTASLGIAKLRGDKTSRFVPLEAFLNTGPNPLYKSYPETGLRRTSTSKVPLSAPGVVIASKNRAHSTVNCSVFSGLPTKSRSLKSRNGFGVQVDLRDPINFERHNEVISSWKDAQSEQARLKARLCVSRTRRFVHLDAEEDGIDTNDDDKIGNSDSSSISSSGSICEQDMANDDADEVSVEIEGPSLKSFLNSHLNHVQKQTQSGSDPLRFMEVYKKKHQNVPYCQGGDLPPARKMNDLCAVSDVSSDVDKTSDAASTLPSMLEECRPVEAAVVEPRPREASAALGLSLTAELHRYETLSASDQNFAELEMTRQVSLAKLGNRGREMTYVEHLQEVENQAVSPIVVPGRGRIPVTLTQTITQRSFTTSATGATATAQLLPGPGHTQMTAANSFVESSVNNYYIQRGVGPNASSLNPIDTVPSNLEVSTAFGEMIEKQSEPFKGMLQQRVSDLDARRREAEMLINLAQKIDREEHKVYLLENLAVKALTQKKVVRQPLKALAHAVEASSSSARSAKTSKRLPAVSSSLTVIPLSQHSSSTVLPLPPEESPVSSSCSIASTTSASTVEISAEGTAADTSSANDIPSSIVSIPKPISPSVAVNSQGVDDSQLREQLFVSADCNRTQHQSNNQSNRQKASELFTPISSGSRKGPLLAKSSSPINSLASSFARLPTDSLSVSSDIDLAAILDAKLKALKHDLERQQSLLTQIKRQKRRTKNKDSLIRLEATLEQHQKLVEGIITGLKADIATFNEEKSALMSLDSTSQASPASEASLSVSKMAVERVPKPGGSGTLSVEVDVSVAENEKSSDEIGSEAQRQAVNLAIRFSEKSNLNGSFNLDMSVKPSPSNSCFTETSRQEAIRPSDNLLALKPGVLETSADRAITALSSGRTSRAPSVPDASGKLSKPESDSYLTSARKPYSLKTTVNPPKEATSRTGSEASLELLSRTLINSRNFDDLTTSDESTQSSSPAVGAKVKSLIDDKSVDSKREEQVCSSGKFMTLKMMSAPEVSEKLEQSFKSNSILQLPSTTELLKSTSGVCKANLSKLEGSDISHVILTLDDSQKASTPIRLNQDMVEVAVPVSPKDKDTPKNEVLKSQDNLSTEDAQEDKSCTLDTIPSELSLATPSLHSDIKGEDITQEVASEKALSAKCKSRSEDDIEDVYSKDFEDEDFPEEEVHVGQESKAPNLSITQPSPAASDPLAILSRIDSRSEELLEEWLDLFIEDTLDELVDDISLDFIGVTPEDLIPKHSTRASSECQDEISDTTGLIVNMPSRTMPLFKSAMEFFFKLRANVQRGTFEFTLKSVDYPPEFSGTYIDERDMVIYKEDPDVCFVSRPLFFDLLRTGMLEIFAGEDNDIQFNREIVYTSARLHMWGGKNRPESQERWEAYLGPQLEAILGISLNPEAAASEDPVPLPTPMVYDPSVVRGTVSKWTLNSKHYVDQLCEVELRADDASWFTYGDFIKSVVEQSTKELTEQMAVDTIHRVVSTLKPSSCNGTCQEPKNIPLYL